MLLHAELLVPSAVSPMLKVTGESEYLHICTTFKITVYSHAMTRVWHRQTSPAVSSLVPS